MAEGLTAPGANCTLTRPVGLDQVAGPPATVLTSDLGRSSPPVADMRPNAPGPTELLMNAPCIHHTDSDTRIQCRLSSLYQALQARSSQMTTNNPCTQIYARAEHC